MIIDRAIYSDGRRTADTGELAHRLALVEPTAAWPG